MRTCNTVRSECLEIIAGKKPSYFVYAQTLHRDPDAAIPIEEPVLKIDWNEVGGITILFGLMSAPIFPLVFMALFIRQFSFGALYFFLFTCGLLMSFLGAFWCVKGRARLMLQKDLQENEVMRQKWEAARLLAKTDQFKQFHEHLTAYQDAVTNGFMDEKRRELNERAMILDYITAHWAIGAVKDPRPSMQALHAELLKSLRAVEGTYGPEDELNDFLSRSPLLDNQQVDVRG